MVEGVNEGIQNLKACFLGLGCGGGRGSTSTAASFGTDRAICRSATKMQVEKHATIQIGWSLDWVLFRPIYIYINCYIICFLGGAQFVPLPCCFPPVAFISILSVSSLRNHASPRSSPRLKFAALLPASIRTPPRAVRSSEASCMLCLRTTRHRAKTVTLPQCANVLGKEQVFS